MRNFTLWVVALLLLCNTTISLGQCDFIPDPPIPFVNTDESLITVCGSEFTLCMDLYDISENVKPDTFPLNVFTNDSGIFDYCLSEVVTGKGPKHGNLIRFPNCQFAYIPGPSFSVIDSFDYCSVVNEICSNVTYCGGGDGKIINILARYNGTKSVIGITVDAKNVSGAVSVTPTQLNPGDYFFADGTQLSKGSPEYKYNFTFSDQTTAEVKVHTSCSAQIFGLPHRAEPNASGPVLMTPISGCLATNGNEMNCSTDPYNQPVTTQYKDVTRVYIISNNTILPIEFAKFNVESKKRKNLVSWNINSVSGEDFLTLEKSYNGSEFFEIMEYYELKTGTYEYEDSDIKRVLNYYRLSVTNHNGEIRYSDIIINRRPGVSRSLSIYPRPCYDITTVSVEGENSGINISKIKVYDLNGKLIRSISNIDNSYSTFDISSLDMNAGLYLLTVELSDGDILHDKLIKQ